MEFNPRRPSFSVHEFKNWMAQQPVVSDFFDLDARMSQPEDEFIGREVSANVSEGKLLQKIEPEDGDVEELIEDLCENGGMILGTSGKNLLIEVGCGSFYIPRFCLKIKKLHSS